MVHPFPFMKSGRDKNVAAAIVVPTNAATNIFPPATLGIVGTNPFTISIESGCTKNSESRNDKPIALTNTIKIFSKKVYLPISISK